MKPEQITAWALDEASAEERLQLEAALLENPKDKHTAEETKAFCDFLLSELRDESLALTEVQREKLKVQPVAKAGPEPDASGTLALPTRWRIGGFVRLAVAACVVLGGFWSWHVFSLRESVQELAVVDELGIRVNLPMVGDARKKENAGSEARLLAEQPVEARRLEQEMVPVAGGLPTPTPVSSPVPAVGALALKKSQGMMTEGDVAELKKIQDQQAYGLNFGDKMMALPALADSSLDGDVVKFDGFINFGSPISAIPAATAGGITLHSAGGIVKDGTGLVTLGGATSLSRGDTIQRNSSDLAGTGALTSVSSAAAGASFGTVGVVISDPVGMNAPVDLMSAPTVTTKSGTKATMVVTREFVYPVEFAGGGYDLIANGAVSAVLPGGMTKAGAGTLVTVGGGALTMNKMNTFTGGTTVNGGVLSPTVSVPASAFGGFNAAVGGMNDGQEVSLGFATALVPSPAAAPQMKMNSIPGTAGVNTLTDTTASGVGDARDNVLILAGSALSAPAGAPHHVSSGVLTISGGVVVSTQAAPRAEPLTGYPQTAAVAQVQSGLLLGNSSTEIGNYDAAIAQYQDVLRTDPYNAAARRGMEAAEQKKQAYIKTAYDSQRSKMLAQVSESWEAKVPTLAVSGGAVMGKDVKTDDFYLGANALPEYGKAERPSQPSAGEAYTRIIENEMKEVAREPLSTLSIDVDTASYANVRRFLNQNMIPPPDAVRIEELVNYFPTAEEGPAHDAKEPFAVRVELAPCPWQPVHRLARIAIKGREMDKDRKASNLVFLVDVSGSMNEPTKLPLVQQSLRMLTEQLGEGDRVTMVVYAGSSGVVLPPTNGEKRGKILAAIDKLSAGGSTHGSAGIKLAYEQAVAGFIKGGVNRVILCTDGDFNVGVSSPEELERLIKQKAKSGVFLSVLGFGSGNLKDRTMETLADKGNGNYAYIDSLSEARKVLVEQMSGTLVTIAKDVKIQVEFNPAAVRSYRLIGYENRLLAKEDFNDDTKDAGEIGAGHSVVALYEVVPANLPPGAEPRPAVDSLKYQAAATPPSQLAEAAKSGEMMTVKLRYKEPESDLSKLIEMPTKDEGKTLTASTEEFKFSAAVAGFGLLLRDSSYKGTLSWETVRRLALDGKGADKQGYRGEFLQLIDKARGLKETR